MTLRILPFSWKRNFSFIVAMITVSVLMGSAFVSVSMAREEEHALSKKLDLSLYGYVETSYTQNFNNPLSGINQNRSFDGDANSFRPNMAQIVLEKGASTDGDMVKRAGFRIKLDIGEDEKFTGGTGADDFDFQEAYVNFIAPIGNGLRLQAGRMNTLIGYEVIESPLNPNFSRSFMFGMGEPFTVTGVRAAYDFNEYVTFAMSAINSFTGTQVDLNNSKSVEALLSIAPMDNVGISIFGFWGPEGVRGASNADRLQIGGILDVQVTKKAEVVVEAYYGNQANASRFPMSSLPAGVNARWNGVAGYFIYDFNDQWGARVRAEIFEDKAGLFSCQLTNNTVAGNAQACFPGSNNAQTLWESTWTLQYKPVPSVITRIEFRHDKSNQNTFQEGVNGVNNQSTLAGEAIFLF